VQKGWGNCGSVSVQVVAAWCRVGGRRRVQCNVVPFVNGVWRLLGALSARQQGRTCMGVVVATNAVRNVRVAVLPAGSKAGVPRRP